MDISYFELYNNREDAMERKNVLAIVIEFDISGKVVVKWNGDISSIVLHDSLENFMKVSLNGARYLVDCDAHGDRHNVYLVDGCTIKYEHGKL